MRSMAAGLLIAIDVAQQKPEVAASGWGVARPARDRRRRRRLLSEREVDRAQRR